MRSVSLRKNLYKENIRKVNIVNQSDVTHRQFQVISQAICFSYGQTSPSSWLFSNNEI